MSYVKPQSPMQQGDDYFYPLTTADQVILTDGTRLNGITDISDSDNGKFLRVVNGKMTWVTIASAEGGSF